MAEAKKNFLENYIDAKTAENEKQKETKAQKKAAKEDEIIAKGKDPENKFNFIADVILDPQTGLRKVPIGPSMEELQESQLAADLDPDYKRPISHIIKDTIATTGPALASLASKVAIKPIVKAVGNKAVSNTVKRILKNAEEGVGKIRNYSKASKEGSKEIVGAAKSVERLNHEIADASRQIGNMKYGFYDDTIKNLTEVTKGKRLTDKELDKLYKMADLLHYQKDVSKDGLFSDLYKILEEELGPIKGGKFASGSGRLYDFTNEKDLFDLAYKDPDVARKILRTWDEAEELAKKSNKSNLTKMYNKAEDALWKKTHKNLAKDLDRINLETTVSKLKDADIYGDIERTIKKGSLPSEKEKIRVKNAILKNAKKVGKENTIFEKLMNPNDPIYKLLLENSEDLVRSDDNILKYIKEGMSFQEAVQNSALDFIFNSADREYVNALVDLANGKNAMDIDSILRKHPFRNLDGSIKSEEEIIKSIRKNPFYEELIKGYIDKTLMLPKRVEKFASAKASEGAAGLLLANYTNKMLKDAAQNAKMSDPFSKKSVLPPEMQPWNPDLEMNYADRFWGNVGDILDVNWSGSPHRFTTRQKELYRKAIIPVAEELGFENPEQIKALDDREFKELINKIGDLKYGREVIKKIRANLDDLLEQRKVEQEEAKKRVEQRKQEKK